MKATKEQLRAELDQQQRYEDAMLELARFKQAISKILQSDRWAADVGDAAEGSLKCALAAIEDAVPDHTRGRSVKR